MKRRYASHYLFFPGHGYLKQYVVEVDTDQRVSRLFHLTEEVEDTEWLPGVIVLLPEQELDNSLFDECRSVLEAVPPGFEEELPRLRPWLFFPFDFTAMQPVAGTRRRPLP